MNAHTPVAAPAPTLEIVTSPERLAALAPAWTALWRRVDGLVFQSHGWVSAWWRTDHNIERRALLIGLVWVGGALKAVLPLATVRRKGVRLLEWAAKDHSDYGDILVAPDCDPAALAAIWRRVLAEGAFDMAYLNRLLPDAAVRPLLTAARFRPNHRSELNFRVAGPWRTGAEWFEAQSKKTRQNYRRSCKFLEEAGAVRFRLLGADEPLAPILARVAMLKRKWMAERGHESDLFDRDSTSLEALVAVLAELGILRIFVLECAGTVIAVSINFVQRNRMMAFVTTYDSDFERGSPGTVLMMDYIQWSIDQGLEMVDFLCGGEDFKRRFATETVVLDSVVCARTLRGQLAMLADGAHHRFKTWQARRRAAAAIDA